jgi:hypothetical protein
VTLVEGIWVMYREPSPAVVTPQVTASQPSVL